MLQDSKKRTAHGEREINDFPFRRYARLVCILSGLRLQGTREPRVPTIRKKDTRAACTCDKQKTRQQSIPCSGVCLLFWFIAREDINGSDRTRVCFPWSFSEFPVPDLYPIFSATNSLAFWSASGSFSGSFPPA